MSSTDPAAAARSRGMVSSLATLLATGFGSGYSRFAPGTAGSAVGVVLLWPCAGWPLPYQGILLLAIFFLGVAAASHVARQVGIKDPGIVVVDEIIGVWLSLFGLPFTPGVVLAGFLLFRVMDVVKPPPARWLEHLPGGWGIVLDDVMAGVYAHLVLRGALFVWTGP